MGQQISFRPNNCNGDTLVNQDKFRTTVKSLRINNKVGKRWEKLSLVKVIYSVGLPHSYAIKNQIKELKVLIIINVPVQWCNSLNSTSTWSGDVSSPPGTRGGGRYSLFLLSVVNYKTIFCSTKTSYILSTVLVCKLVMYTRCKKDLLSALV